MFQSSIRSWDTCHMVFEDSPLPLTQMTSAGQNVFIHEDLCGTYDLYLHAAGGFSACYHSRSRPLCKHICVSVVKPFLLHPPSINFMVVKRQRAAAPLSLCSVYPKLKPEHNCCSSQRGPAPAAQHVQFQLYFPGVSTCVDMRAGGVRTNP